MYNTYKKERYLYFWLSFAAYFLPYIITTCCLLPMVKETAGTKTAIGFAIVFINAIPFLGGVLRNIFAHLPFVNMIAIMFVALGTFFLADVFQHYVYSFLAIEGAAAAGSIVACVFWVLHRKYKTKAETVKTVVKSGVLGGV